MTIRDELLAIKGNEELLIPQKAVDWAKANPNSALHSALPWDDAYAANQHRLHMVRQLISIHIVYAGGDRQFVSLSIDRTRDGGGYRNIDDVLPIPDLREIMLNDALKDLERIQLKYGRVKELAGVWDEANKVQETVKRRRRKAA